MVPKRHRLGPMPKAIVNTLYGLAVLGFVTTVVLQVAASVGRGERVSWTFLAALSWLGVEWADKPKSLAHLHAFLSGTPLGLGLLVLLSGTALLLEELFLAFKRPRDSIDSLEQ